MFRPHVNFFLFCSPMVCLCVWTRHTRTLCPFLSIWYPLTEHMSIYQSIGSELFFLFVSGTDNYDPVEINIILEKIDEIKQCSRAQRSTHQNKTYAWRKFCYWFCELRFYALRLLIRFSISSRERRPCCPYKLKVFFSSLNFWTTWYGFGWSRVENVIEYI